MTTIRRNAERLRELSEDLLVLSRWDTEKRSLTGEERPFDEVDLAEVLDRVRATMTTLATRQGVALTFDVPDGPLVITGLASDLERALLNLSSNAVKYTPAGGGTGCLVHRDAGLVVIEVCDSGIGIADDEIGRLFTRFFRASSARERSIAGIGLGLSIVQEIVAAHAGDITVSSRLGEGTVVVVRLPVAATDSGAWSPPAAEQPRDGPREQASLA